MDVKKKDSLFRLAGLSGLILLLIFFFALEKQRASMSSLNGKDVKSEKSASFETQELPSGKIEGGKRKVAYEAYQYGFSPDPLVVVSREIIELMPKSRDVTHGIMIPEIGFNVEVYPNKTSTATFTAPSKPGKYPVFCSIFCGSGHGDMQGTMIVLPADYKEAKK